MKRYIQRLFASLSVILLTLSCGTVGSKSGGLNDEAYIIVASGEKYQGVTVVVFVDKHPGRTVLAIREGGDSNRNSHRLVVQPGRRRVVVEDMSGGILFDKEIFVSTRNTKTIVIP